MYLYVYVCGLSRSLGDSMQLMLASWRIKVENIGLREG